MFIGDIILLRLRGDKKHTVAKLTALSEKTIHAVYWDMKKAVWSETPQRRERRYVAGVLIMDKEVSAAEHVTAVMVALQKAERRRDKRIWTANRTYSKFVELSVFPQLHD